MSKWQVIVENVGTTYDGDNGAAAFVEYGRYKRAIASGQAGRASWGSVTLFCDDDILHEYSYTRDSKPVLLNDWSVTDDHAVNPYTPPEHTRKRLQGTVVGHPTRPDGERVVTSVIDDVVGRIVFCESRPYRLGKIAPGYRKYLRENRPDWDWRNPIKWVEGEE